MQANLEWFRTFIAIYDTGTMSGAAKRLYISQPGVGLHLNSLEAYTGFPLFERTARKMVPTDKGKLLYQQLSQSLQQLESIEQRFQRKCGIERATISVGMCVETFQQALEKHIPGLDFNLIMQFEENARLTHSLENGELDLILTTAPGRNNSNVVFEPFFTERMILVAGKHTKLEEFSPLMAPPDNSPSGNKSSGQHKAEELRLIHLLKKQLWYNTAADMGVLNLFWDHNFKTLPGFVPNYIVPNKYSIIRCLSQGSGLAVLPDFICRQAIREGAVFRIWDGYTPMENIIYLGKRKQSLYKEEIDIVQGALQAELSSRVPAVV